MGRYISTLIPIIILILFPAFDALGQTSKDVDRLYKQGQDLYKKVGSRADMEKAVQKFEQALTTHREIGDKKGESYCLTNIGMVYSTFGQYSKALEYYEKSLEIKRKIVDVRGEGTSLGNIGNVYYSLGQYAKALEYYEKSMGIMQRIGVPTDWTSSCIGHIYLDMGRIEEADPFIRASKDDAALGRLHLMKSDYSEALKHYGKLQKKAEENLDTNDLFIAYTGLGRVFEAKEDYGKAAEYYEKAVKTVEDMRLEVPPFERKAEDCKVNVPLMTACTDIKSFEEILALVSVYDRTGDMEALRRLILSYVKSGKCVELTANETIKVIRREDDILVLFKKDGKYLWAFDTFLDCKD